jgi:hypothetical protein
LARIASDEMGLIVQAEMSDTEVVVTQYYRPMTALDEARASHQTLSSAAAQFLDYALENHDRIEQLKHLADGLPPWTRTYATTELTWPTFVGPEKLRQIKSAVEKVCDLVKSLPARIFNGDSERISDFYSYGDASLIGLLLEPPNGIKGAVARCDFIDGPAGFKCCEINMAANVGGWESRFWEQKYFAHPVISRFLVDRGIHASHHDPLQTLCLHVVEDTVASGICPDGVLNVAIKCSSKSLPSAEGAGIAQGIYSDLLRAVNAAVQGRVVFWSRADELSAKNGHMYYGDLRIHAVLNYSGAVLPKQVYWCHKAGTISLYNGPLTRMLSDKRNLALLSEFEDSEIFDDEERKIIHDHVPWSRSVIAGETTYQGETVSFPGFLIAFRDRLVLKLGIGFGGKDIHLGRFTPAEEWNQRVEEAVSHAGWMVQEQVESYPYVYADGEGKVQPQNVVWGMFCFGSRYGGGYLRMLPKGVRRGVVNSGGGAVEGPIFEV